MLTTVRNWAALVAVWLAALATGWATHNRAGEITYEQIGPLTIRAKITTYTKISGQSIHADRSELTLHWGDGTEDVVPRTSNVLVHPDIQRNEYVYDHTYPGANNGQPYVMYMQDPNRNQNILNINGGNSVDIEFYLQTEVFLLATSIYGFNNSPILLEPPIDFGVKGQIFQHTPNGYDPDGDSIAYELIVPARDQGTPVPNYQVVSDIVPGPNNQYTFDVHTGLFTWTTPQKEGEYNIAILVKSYRNGLYLGGIVRDIQIEIRNSLNTPPIIEAPEEICVWAGELIEFDVTAYDNDIPTQQVTLTATGGPFQVPISPATFSGSPTGNPVVRPFRWQTQCVHIQAQPYQVVFKARDTLFSSNPAQEASLATFKVLTIRVLAPPPQNVQATVVGSTATITWDAPYVCEGAPGFFGFTVWRKPMCDPFIPDSCEVGLAGHGYTQINIGNLVTTPTGGQYVYVDNTIEQGMMYSYRILGSFGTPIYNGSGSIINFHSPTSSVPSEEVCIESARDLPLITNVDVTATDPATGSMFVQWSRPDPTELDTTQNLPPYRYELYRTTGQSGTGFGTTPIFTSPNYASFSAAIDTFFTDTNLNTEAEAYSYRVAFYTNGDLLGNTDAASSIFLQVASTDATNNLTWTENVPWMNPRYVVYEETPVGSGAFTVLDTVETQAYSHTGLTNGSQYCYMVKGIGTYNMGGVLDPLLNRSQVACGIPLDTVAPCPPMGLVQIEGCQNVPDNTPMADLFNTIAWNNSPQDCANDVARFRVYFAPYCNGQYILIGESQGLNDTFLIHQPSVDNLAGCYYVTAIDSIEVNGGGNESAPGNVVQTDNCPIYNLPNVFTPNSDNRNDFFTPFKPYRYIQAVDFKVYNRWGQVIFESTDPNIGWDGRDAQTGKLVIEGVYYYTCIVTENRLQPQVYPLKGYIHVMYGGGTN